MPIIGPADLPAVLKVASEPMKRYALAQLGYPNVAVEITEDQLEIALRNTGDWIAGYFPHEQRLAVFNTTPLQSTYPMPSDAYWVQEVRWDPVTTRIDDVFGAESFLFNIGNISGIQNMLLDYHLLQAYRKFSQKVLGTEGHWEVLGEVDGPSSKQLIRLYPTPKGVFPVVVLYTPIINQFRSPQAKKLAYDMLVAEVKCMVGNARRKMANMPNPAGGTIGWDGGDLVTEGIKEKEDITTKAIQMGEPLGVYLW
jgi:hypothetical protein